VGTVIQLEMHSDSDHMSEIDLDRLSPRARALAQAWHARMLPCRGAVVIQSARTIREMDPDADPTWYTPEQLDAPHRVVWTSWSYYPQNSTMDPHDYLEQQAQRLPVGYVVVGPHRADRVPSVQEAMGDAHLITRAQLLEELRRLGRPIAAATLDLYRSPRFAPAGFPQPVQFVGRTPLWDLRHAEEYVRSVGAR
jgi:hypothetical protein